MQVITNTDDLFVAKTRVTGWIWLALGYSAVMCVGFVIGLADFDRTTLVQLCVGGTVGVVAIFAMTNYRRATLTLDRAAGTLTATVNGTTTEAPLDVLDEMRTLSYRGQLGAKARNRGGVMKHLLVIGAQKIDIPTNTDKQAAELQNRIRNWRRRGSA